MLFSAAEDLATVGFTLTENSRNFGVFVLEHFAQKEYRPFNRSQALQHDKKRHGNRFIDPDDFQRIASWTGNDRFRKPLAYVLLALNPRGLQVVDAQAANDGDQECSRGSNLLPGACCQRIKVSCSMSSASATLPNMR